MITTSSVINNYLKNYSGLSKICWHGVLLIFIEATLGGVCFFLSLYFVEILHIDIATSGIIFSFFGLGTVLGGLIGGKLSDKFSPGKISMYSLLVEAISFFALIKLKTANLLMLNLFILGLASYSFITSNNLWVLNNCETHEKLKVINILTVASNLGIGMAAFIVSLLSEDGFPYYFALNGFLFILSGVYLLFLESNKNLKSIEQTSEMDINKEKKQNDPNKKNKLILRLILICLFAVGTLVSQLGTTCSIYIKEAFPQFSINGISLLFGINSFLVIFFQAPIVNFFSNTNKMLVAGAGAFLIGFSMFMLTFTFVFMFAIMSRVIYTVGEMLFFSTAQLICYEHGLEKKKGQSLGIYRMTYAMSIVVGPAIGGFAYKYLGSVNLWYISGVVGALCLWFCYKYR